MGFGTFIPPSHQYCLSLMGVLGPILADYEQKWGGVAPWTSGQLSAGPTQRHKQPSTLTLTPETNLK